MNFDLEKHRIIRRVQDDAYVSFRLCFGSGKDWMALDMTLDKSKFKELSKMDHQEAGSRFGELNPSVFNLDRAKIGFAK